jgi:hypothetical protein
MSYGYKLINLNTADPYIISDIIGDYLRIKDYSTLKRIGLTQSVIDNLENGTKSFYAPWTEVQGPDYIKSGEIDPPNDLDIPGDLYKWYWITPDSPRYSTGDGSGKKVIKPLAFRGAAKTPYVHPSLLNFETAPTVNRLLSLWNSYGGDRSVIMTFASGFGVGGLNVFGSVLNNRSEFPELDNYPVYNSIPFSGDETDNFYYLFNMNNAYNGIYSGFNYSAVVDGANPNDSSIHSYGVDGKIQIPRYLNRFKGGRRQEDCHFYVRFELTNVYLEASLLRSGRIGYFDSSTPGAIPVNDGSGTFIVPNKLFGVIPWLEWPEVWNGSVYAPEKSPVGRYENNGDRDSMIEFMKELSEHTQAWKEWFDAGCPCDWQDWGGYVDPSVEAIQKQDEEVAISTATKYVPAVTTSAAPPQAPKFGDLWRDSNTGVTKVFTQTSSSTGAWVDQ